MIKNVVIAILGLALIAGAYFYTYTETSVLPTTPVADKKGSEMCAQVITPALNPETGDITEFPTPCDVPEGWEIIQNDIPDLELNLE